MSTEKSQMFRNRLQKTFRHAGKLARRQGISCYRVYDQDLPEFPFSIDFYGDELYVAEYKRRHQLSEEAHAEWLRQSVGDISETLLIDPDHIHLKLRQRKPGRFGQYQKLNAEDAAEERIVEENGLKFLVNLDDYLDTGLFLDHRITRQLVREQSSGKHVLNLFAYTGSFSVYAAAGGAASVTTIDLSNTYLSWARRNMLLNGFGDEGKYPMIQTDVMQWLVGIPAGGFDLIVMDPPSFSNSKRMEDFLDIQRDHAGMINQCIRGLKPGGSLYFSTNLRDFVLDMEAIDSREIKDITRQTTPFDFEGKLLRWCYRVGKER